MPKFANASYLFILQGVISKAWWGDRFLAGKNNTRAEEMSIP